MLTFKTQNLYQHNRHLADIRLDAEHVRSLGCKRTRQRGGRLGPRALGLRKERRQLRNVACDAASLIHRQHLRGLGLLLCITRVDVSQRLAAGVLDYIAARNLFGGPGRGEAAHRFTKEILWGWRNQRTNPSADCRRR